MIRRYMYVMFLCSGMIVLFASQVNGQASPMSGIKKARQDGRFVNPLEWVSPPGIKPGSYAEYRALHPSRPAVFSRLKLLTPSSQERKAAQARISLLIDENLAPSIQPALAMYQQDLLAEGYSVVTATVSGGTAAEIKAWIRSEYNSGSEGVVLIGDITAAWAEVSGDVFPSDLFYMDLDGLWRDMDNDGDYEVHDAGFGDEGPELYVARIYAHTLDYAPEATMTEAYLTKSHDYKQGILSQPWRGLEYVEEDWFDMEVNLNQVYDQDVVRYDFGYSTSAAGYLDQLDLGQHFVQVCVHSFSGGHYFSRHPTEAAVYAHVYVHSPTTQSVKLQLGCDDGIKAWLNGNVVCVHDVSQGWTPDQYVIATSLNSGWNRLLCKISQGGGDYQFSARFTDPDDQIIPDLTYQLNDPASSGPDDNFIHAWLVNGFYQDSDDNFYNYLTTNYLGSPEDQVNPQEGQVMGGFFWTRLSSDGPYIDYQSSFDDPDFGACYAFVRVFSPEAVSGELWLGYDDGARVWLNGQEILNDNRYGGYTVDMTKVPVDLVAGQNRLLVKISEWMGDHGFSARFCFSDGTPMNVSAYDPGPDPVNYIGNWLVNGPYENADGATRLTQDYLGNESTVSPSAGDPAPLGSWELGYGSGYPFDIAAYYDHGDWVLSQDVQDRDAPVLFYNLFSCGPGRFTDQNYLAGAYIFNTSTSLITIASSKSGSMLNFLDFTEPLGRGMSVGQAFREWFETQAPFELWEREWYYGLVLNGDPTLRPLIKGDLDHDQDIDQLDFDGFSDCFTGPGPTVLSDSCRCADFDNDQDVDCDDWTAFQAAWTGPPTQVPPFVPCDGAVPALSMWAVLALLIGLSLFLGHQTITSREEKKNIDHTLQADTRITSTAPEGGTTY
ncbi:hypothetical protein JXQ70_16430 [bacterium]|nr:hypothetical protein [bacterium]